MIDWFRNVIGPCFRRPPPPPVDRTALREEMTRDDPDFRRVRAAHHDAQQVVTANEGIEGMLRRQRRADAQADVWRRHG